MTNLVRDENRSVALGGAQTINFTNPTKFPAKTDIKVSAKASAAGGVGATALRGWLE